MEGEFIALGKDEDLMKHSPGICTDISFTKKYS
jgi:hypothetical protein